MACHGADAAGSADFPRLAGQHARYVIKQLNCIQSLVRAAPVMHGIVKDRTPKRDTGRCSLRAVEVIRLRQHRPSVGPIPDGQVVSEIFYKADVSA